MKRIVSTATATNCLRCLRSSLGITFEEIAQIILSYCLKIPWMKRWMLSSGPIGFTKLRTECKSFGKPTKEVSCWLKEEKKRRWQISKTLVRVFYCYIFFVWLGWWWTPVSYGLTYEARVLTVVAMLDLLPRWVSRRATKKSQGIVYFTTVCGWLYVRTLIGHILMSVARVTCRCIYVRCAMWWKVGGVFLLVRLWPQNQN